MSKVYKKKFAHKVRTGCITCKRRRVKCGEERPSCNRCKRAELDCQGYDVPKPRFFDFIPPQGYQQFDASSSSRSLEEKPCLTLCTTISPYSTVFRDTDELMAFDMYLSRTAPMLATYSPQIGSIYTNIIPQQSLGSPTLKHIMLALGLVMQSSGTNPTHDMVLVPKAMSHYSKAIQGMIQGNSPRLCALLTAFLAWCMEMMCDNYEVATMHLNGMRAMMRDVETKGISDEEEPTLKLIQTLVQRSLELAEGFLHITQQSATKEDGFYVTDPSLKSLRAARMSLGHELDKYARSEKQHEDLGELRSCLQLWINKIRKWDQTLPLSPNRDALRVLLLLALSSLPADETAGFSHSLNSSVVEHALKTVSELRRTNHLDKDSAKELGETLKLVLVHIIRYYKEPDYQAQAASMLSVLSIQDD